jgi:anti-sigma B factor antagonist
MVLDISTRNGVLIITLVPRFDGESAPPVEQELKKIVEQNPERILFDFSMTEYVASAGIRVLLSITRSILRQGGMVALSSLSPRVKRVFEIAGFTKIFSIYDSQEEALHNLRRI